jgi:hypothetical protein
MGLDPHTLTAYTSPALGGKEYAVFEDDVDGNGNRTFLAVVDLQALLALRPPGVHTVAGPLKTCEAPGVPDCVVRYIPIKLQIQP